MPATKLTNICGGANVMTVMKLIGYIVLVVKIVIPLVIIILGSVDLLKVMASGKDDQLKTSVASLVRRVIAGILIFFAPTIVNIAFNIINNLSPQPVTSTKCVQCITSPNSCGTTTGTIKY